VNDAGDVNAAWRIGEAFLKVQEQSYQKRTREHVTLNFLHDPTNGFALTSSIPRVLYHNEFNKRYYLITTRIAGETLEKAWPAMSEAAKQACVAQVVDTCKTLAQIKRDRICGIDGAELSEGWMNPFAPKQYTHEALLEQCKNIGMTEEEAFMLYHCDMGPTNVLVDLSNDCKVGIIDWEVTGFVPKTWIRTKFCVCGAMDFDFVGRDVERSKDWRERVQLQLEQEGFPEVAKAWERLFWENYDATRMDTA
jgi:serine/threonine protein kinase